MKSKKTNSTNLVEAKTIGEAWLESCSTILKNGEYAKDEDVRIKELTHLIVCVSSPQETDEIIERYGKKENIEWMMLNFFEQKLVPEFGNSLSYGARLFDYDGKNQIQWVIEKLRKKPETKSATIPLLMPTKDKSYIPCVSLLDFKIRDGGLMLTAFCRSLDFGTKAYANFAALARIQDMVAKELKIGKSKMVVHVVSAHVYEKDFENMGSIIKDRKNQE
jgi:thymidylate synthase